MEAQPDEGMVPVSKVSGGSAAPNIGVAVNMQMPKASPIVDCRLMCDSVQAMIPRLVRSYFDV